MKSNDLYYKNLIPFFIQNLNFQKNSKQKVIQYLYTFSQTEKNNNKPCYILKRSHRIKIKRFVNILFKTSFKIPLININQAVFRKIHFSLN